MNWQLTQLQGFASQRRDDLLREAEQGRLAAMLGSIQPAHTSSNQAVAQATSQTTGPAVPRDGVTLWRPRLVHEAY